MNTTATPRTLPSAVCILDPSYTQTQRVLNEMVLLRFRAYSFTGLRDNHIICLFREEIVPFLPFRKVLYAIKTMATKSVSVVDLAGEGVDLLYEGPLYANVSYGDKIISFETNPALKPHWNNILDGTLTSDIIHNFK
jgi:hypothetical protein